MNDEEGQVHNGVGLLNLPSLGPVTLQCNINRSDIPVILRTFATCREVDRCAVCLRTLLWFWCLCLSSKERQFTLSSMPLITSVVALCQHDGCWNSFVSKVRAHLKKVCPPNEDDISLSCRYPITSPQPSSASSATPCIPQLHPLEEGNRNRVMSRGDHQYPNLNDRGLKEMTPHLAKTECTGTTGLIFLKRETQGSATVCDLPKTVQQGWNGEGGGLSWAWTSGHHTLSVIALESPGLICIICDIHTWAK